MVKKVTSLKSLREERGRSGPTINWGHVHTRWGQPNLCIPGVKQYCQFLISGLTSIRNEIHAMSIMF